jgi:hypothetical protein
LNMMNRRTFVKGAALLGTGLALGPEAFAFQSCFPVVRRPVAERRFRSKSVEKTIATFQAKVKDKELG